MQYDLWGRHAIAVAVHKAAFQGRWKSVPPVVGVDRHCPVFEWRMPCRLCSEQLVRLLGMLLQLQGRGCAADARNRLSGHVWRPGLPQFGAADSVCHRAVPSRLCCQCLEWLGVVRHVMWEWYHDEAADYDQAGCRWGTAVSPACRNTRLPYTGYQMPGGLLGYGVGKLDSMPSHVRHRDDHLPWSRDYFRHPVWWHGMSALERADELQPCAMRDTVCSSWLGCLGRLRGSLWRGHCATHPVDSRKLRQYKGRRKHGMLRPKLRSAAFIHFPSEWT